MLKKKKSFLILNLLSGKDKPRIQQSRKFRKNKSYSREGRRGKKRQEWKTDPEHCPHPWEG